MSPVDTVALILSIVALAVTVLGFMASLKFYRDGMEMQQAATRTLVAIEEKATMIHGSVNGMFDKTLNAALSPRANLEKKYDELEAEIEGMAARILQRISSDIGNMGDYEMSRIKEYVDEEVDRVREGVESVQDAARHVYVPNISAPAVGGAQKEVLDVLACAKEPLSPPAIAARCGLNPEGFYSVQDALRRKGFVETMNEGGVVGLVITSSGLEAIGPL